MNILSLIAAGLVAAVLSIILRQYKPEFGMYISLASGILILVAVIAAVRPALDMLSELTEKVGMNGIYTESLLKALAICYVVSLATDTCRDAGEAAIATKIEMAGKVAIIVISLPLFTNLVSIITGITG
jgi:stage III sporulation protein AD